MVSQIISSNILEEADLTMNLNSLCKQNYWLTKLRMSYYRHEPEQQCK